MATMTQKYVLQCGSCEAKQPVETRHAGSVIRCSQCDAPIEVPKLRALKQLEPIATDSTRTRKREWGRLSGTLFALGLLLLAIGFGSVCYVYLTRAKLSDYTEKPNIENLEFKLDINDASLTDSWRVWEQLLRRRDIVQRDTPFHVHIRDRVERLDFWMYFFSVFATVGLISMISSLFFRPRVSS